MKTGALDRRTLLRGAGATIALPLLDAMLDSNGTALAAGAPLPRRFGLFFWANGVRIDQWVPAETGPAWSAPAELQPLATPALKPYVSVVSGMQIKIPVVPHHSIVAMLSGAPYLQQAVIKDEHNDTIMSTYVEPTIDVVVAREWKGRTRFPSLELAVNSQVRLRYEGTSHQYVSHNGPDNYNPPESSPQKLFARLFGQAVPTPQRMRNRRSVLDNVAKDALALRARLGASDRARVDQHLESIRGLETRLQMADTVCTQPLRSPGDIGDSPARQDTELRASLMADVLAAALSCDLTRVFSIEYTLPISDVVFWQIGTPHEMHQLTHEDPPPAPMVHAAVTYSMQRLAVILDKLRATPDGPGRNLLDSLAIYACSEHGHGWDHTLIDVPILVIGKAGGALRGGIHYRSQSAENTSKAMLTVLRAVGIARSEFGTKEGRVTDSITAIEA